MDRQTLARDVFLVLLGHPTMDAKPENTVGLSYLLADAFLAHPDPMDDRQGELGLAAPAPSPPNSRFQIPEEWAPPTNDGWRVWSRNDATTYESGPLYDGRVETEETTGRKWTGIATYASWPFVARWRFAK